MGAFPIKNILWSKDLVLPRSSYKLEPPGSDSGRPGGLAAWLFPACHKPTLARGRYQHVEMEISVRLQHIVSPPVLQSGGTGDAASDLTATTLGLAVLASSAGESSSV